jgi:hypothetical protein
MSTSWEVNRLWLRRAGEEHSWRLVSRAALDPLPVAKRRKAKSLTDQSPMHLISGERAMPRACLIGVLHVALLVRRSPVNDEELSIRRSGASSSLSSRLHASVGVSPGSTKPPRMSYPALYVGLKRRILACSSKRSRRRRLVGVPMVAPSLHTGHPTDSSAPEN